MGNRGLEDPLYLSDIDDIDDIDGDDGGHPDPQRFFVGERRGATSCVNTA